MLNNEWTENKQVVWHYENEYGTKTIKLTFIIKTHESSWEIRFQVLYDNKLCVTLTETVKLV